MCVLPLPARKVHAKAFYVRRGHQEFVHLGTGNYNPTNGKLYTDLSLFTSNPQINSDVRAFFKAFEQEAVPELKLLKTAAPIRDFLVESILLEAHKKGHIILKFNHITDRAILEALETARKAGAKIQILVRSTLTRLWDDVNIKSIVGRYLEHARIVAFKNKGAWKVWAASADAMPRNLDGRYELMFPILSAREKNKVLEILHAQVQDDQNSYALITKGQRARWGGKHNGQYPI